jgi:hypothetical protein
MQTVLSAMLLVPLAVGYAGPSATPSASVEHTLDRKEQELEQLYAGAAAARWI